MPGHLVGNTDAHLKNLSFLVSHDGIGLAPFYDLLSTAVYETRAFDRDGWPQGCTLAWPIGQTARVPEIDRSALVEAGRRIEVALVYPQDADISAGKHSVCSDIGAAILGYREGDVIDWRIADRACQIAIRKVLYQPEAVGHFHL